jgi:ribosome maturation factor RimP
MSVDSILNQIVEQVLQEYPHVFLVKAKHHQNHHEYIIDGDQLLGIYDISEISRAINHKADEQLPEAHYELDVCSPGADSDIVLLRQLPKHVGRSFSVVLNDETSFNGQLSEVNGDIVVFKPERPKNKKQAAEVPETISVPFNNIHKAHIILSFK